MRWNSVDAAPRTTIDVSLSGGPEVRELMFETGMPRLYPELIERFAEHARAAGAEVMTIDGDTRTVEEWEHALV